MKLKDTIIDMMRRCPSLFPSKFYALEHLFFVNGNGYEWKNGELVDVCNDDSKCLISHREALNRYKYNTELPSHIYTICEYAKITNIPKNVKPDWFEGVRLSYAMLDEVSKRVKDSMYFEGADRSKINLQNDKYIKELRHFGRTTEEIEELCQKLLGGNYKENSPPYWYEKIKLEHL